MQWIIPSDGSVNMIFWTLVGTLVAGCGGLLVYVYYLRKGQFDDPEDVKYELFRHDDRKPEK